MSSLARGSAFGRYTVLGPLGRGAMGEVYAAYDPDLDRKVALKILHTKDDGADARNRSRLLREAKAIAKLRHANVILVHEAGAIEGRVFLAMEYVEGETLAAWLGAQARTGREIIDVFVAAARGLGAAHAAGIAHRDFKPQNVMVDRAGGVRVTDFGLAREIGASDPVATRAETGDTELAVETRAQALPITRTGELVGTPLYMPPEGFKTQRADARSDQFSFCVALYLALYGAHPFGGNTLGELVAAVTAGRILPAPPKSTVPAWLRRVLVRGLSVDPAARWPSMEALTAALERDPARSRRRWLAGGAIASLLVVAFAAARTPSRTESICRRGPDRLIGVWEAAGGADLTATRRAATRAAFLKTGVEYSAASWDRAAAVLDRYTGAWLGMYHETCVATHERGDQSVEVLDLRMACLTERLGRVKALTDVFADANANVVENAVSAAGALPTLDRCADVALLKAVVPPPDNPAARARVEALRREQARIVALQDSGQCAVAARPLEKLVADADDLGYLPLQAEVLASVSRSDCLNVEDHIRYCRRAVLAGLASHRDDAVAEGATCVALDLASTPDISGARDWIDLAGSVMQRTPGNHAVLESWRLMALAHVYHKEGDLDRAFATLDAARALIARTQGIDHRDFALVLNAIGLVLVDRGRFEKAADYYQRAADVAMKVGGPNSATATLCFANASEALNAGGRYAEAQAAAERALAIDRRGGSSSLLRGYALAMLGQALLGQGQVAEAGPRLEEALVALANDSTVYPQTARFMLARALWSSPGDRPRALALAREAKAGYQKFGKNAPDLAKVDAWLREHATARAR